MTTDRERLGVIEAMARALCLANGNPPDEIVEIERCYAPPLHLPAWETYSEQAWDAFYALHGVVRVVPIEANETMLRAFRAAAPSLLNAATEAGDLTKAEESEPAAIALLRAAQADRVEALQARIAELEVGGAIAAITQFRDILGCGAGPMLSDLPDILRAWVAERDTLRAQVQTLRWWAARHEPRQPIYPGEWLGDGEHD